MRSRKHFSIALNLRNVGLEVFFVFFLTGSFQTSSLFGQQYGDELDAFFFVRSPHARNQAMGKCGVSIGGDLSSVFFNPAGLIDMKGLQLLYGNSHPFYLTRNGNQRLFAAGFGPSRKFSGALTYYIQEFGTYTYFDANGIPVADENMNTELITLSLASELFKNTRIGFDLNYISSNIAYRMQLHDRATAIYPTIGVIEKFPGINPNRVLSVGLSVSNFLFQKISYVGGKGILPVVMRLGTSAEMKSSRRGLNDSLRLFNVLLQCELRSVINSYFRNEQNIKPVKLGFGGEILLTEILSLRLGYFTEIVNDYNFPKYNKQRISDLTYGFGVQIPFYKIWALPLWMKFDYVKLPQTSYIKDESLTNYPNYQSYNISVGWTMGKR